VARFYVGQIEISSAMAEKIQLKHGVTPDEVRELLTQVVPGTWDDDPIRGRRLYVIFQTSGGRTLRLSYNLLMCRKARGGYGPPLSPDGPEGHDECMDTSDDRPGVPNDELDEVDLSEEEFDARMAAGHPVMIIGSEARAQLYERVEDYYTLQVSPPGTILASSGTWGGSAQSLDQISPLASVA
jgi:hypothetical protein